MKNIILISIFIVILGCGNRNTLKLQRADYMSVVERDSSIGKGKSIWIGSIKSSFSNENKLEKFFGKSLEIIVQNEFANSGFTVLERSKIGTVMEEYAFSSTMGANSLQSDFQDANFTALISIVNMQISDAGTWIPLIFTNLDYTIETSVEIKIIDNKTGKIYIKNGTGIATRNSKSLLLFFGDLNVSLNSAVEFSLRVALREALLKVEF